MQLCLGRGEGAEGRGGGGRRKGRGVERSRKMGGGVGGERVGWIGGEKGGGEERAGRTRGGRESRGRRKGEECRGEGGRRNTLFETPALSVVPPPLLCTKLLKACISLHVVCSQV